jgi:hypothetical protein
VCSDLHNHLPLVGGNIVATITAENDGSLLAIVGISSSPEPVILFINGLTESSFAIFDKEWLVKEVTAQLAVDGDSGVFLTGLGEVRFIKELRAGETWGDETDSSPTAPAS